MSAGLGYLRLRRLVTGMGHVRPNLPVLAA